MNNPNNPTLLDVLEDLVYERSGSLAQYTQGRTRAITVLRDKPAGTPCADWLRLPENMPLRTDHPDFIAGYDTIVEITTPIIDL